MSRPRTELDQKLREAIGNDHVYFQPPESIKIKYPCIIYHRQNIDTRHADDKTYMAVNCYDVTIIAKDPDFPLFEEFIHLFPMCRHGRFFTTDNLNHNTYTLYY